MPEKPGNFNISDITLYNDRTGEEMFFNKHPIQILSRPEEVSEIYLEAVPSKTSVFLNEGIRVKYYLYYKSILRTYEIVRFPKFENFQKRFNKKINERPDKVIIGRDVYNRSLKYDVVFVSE